MVKRLQNERELADFIGYLKRARVGSYLEIGSKFGGSLWEIGSALPTGSKIVSVDKPDDPNAFPHLERVINDLRRIGQRVEHFVGDSTAPNIVDAVRQSAPFDAVFIDGNHTLPFVVQDWQNYGPMATKCVAFHDISYHRDVHPPSRLPIDVPNFWKQLKTEHAARAVTEIRYEPQDNGIGIIWREDCP